MATKASTPSPTATAPASAATGIGARVEWIDSARGLAILLVVFGHAAGGLIDAAEPGSMPALRTMFLGLYTFHMPIFFFLSGMFAERRISEGASGFFGKQLTSVVYPYFLWSIIQFTAIFALGSVVNHPAGNYWSTMLALPLRTVSQFWFLHALFLINLLAFVAWRFGGRRAVFGLAVLVKLFAMFVPSTPAISLAASNAPYFALGLLLGAPRVTQLVRHASFESRLLIVAAAGAVLALLCANANSIQPFIDITRASSAGIAKVAWIPAMLPATLLGGAALLLLAESLSRTQGTMAALGRYLGSMSMPIFLLHVLFIAGTRIVLAKLVGLTGIAVLPLLLVLGIAGPLLVRRAADRLGLTRLLALG